MVRPIEYDKQEFLNKTTQLFLEKGYKRITMRDILEHTGLNSHSVYKIFKNKEKLYSEILKNYRDGSLYYGYEILEAKPHGIKNIKAFFAALLAGKDPVDCLMVNTIAECNLMDGKSLEMAKTHFKKIEKSFANNFNQGITDGTVSPNRKALELAGMTVNYMQGLPVSSRTYGNKQVLARTNQFIDLITH